jgi:hypothetical protein
MNIKTNVAADGKPVPGWKLERYLLGELPEGEMEAIRAVEASDGALRGRVDALRADNAALLAKYPLKIAPAGGTGIAGKRAADGEQAHISRDWRRFSGWAIPAFACVALLLVFPARLILPFAPVDSGAFDGDRAKGTTPGIEVWRKAGESAERLAPEAVARTGDIVQLRYVVPKFCYGALVSVDGRGVLTVHLSGDSGKAAPLTPGRPVALDNSYQLDDAPRFEAFYLITAPDNFSVWDVAKSLEKAEHPLDGKRGSTRLPQKQRITAFTLLKPYDSVKVK